MNHRFFGEQRNIGKIDHSYGKARKMENQVSRSFRGRNPDVLNYLGKLSNTFDQAFALQQLVPALATVQNAYAEATPNDLAQVARYFDQNSGAQTERSGSPSATKKYDTKKHQKPLEFSPIALKLISLILILFLLAGCARPISPGTLEPTAAPTAVVQLDEPKDPIYETTAITPEATQVAILEQFPDAIMPENPSVQVIESISYLLTTNEDGQGIAYIATQEAETGLIIVEKIRADKTEIVPQAKLIIFKTENGYVTAYAITNSGEVIVTPTPPEDGIPTPPEDDGTEVPPEDDGTEIPPEDDGGTEVPPENQFDPETIERTTNFPCVESDDQACRISLTVENVNLYGLYSNANSGAKQIFLPDGTPTRFYIEASVNAWTRDTTLTAQNYEIALVIVDSETGKRMVGGKAVDALPGWTLDHFLANISEQFYFQGGKNNGIPYDADTDSWYLNPNANMPRIDQGDIVMLTLPVPGKAIVGEYLAQGVYDLLLPLLSQFYGDENQALAEFIASGNPVSLENILMLTENGKIIIIPGGGTTLQEDLNHVQP